MTTPACPNCEYPLDGLPPVGRCPECGTPYARDEPLAHASPKPAVPLIIRLIVVILALAGVVLAKGGSFGVAFSLGVLAAAAYLTSQLIVRASAKESVRADQPTCGHCGYDLTGLDPATRCPECARRSGDGP
jgi:predicted Zn-ribbon and HTH transcriptional regulator